MKKIVTTVMAFLLTMSAQAQRTVDKLDHGLVAVKTSGGVFCSWRINGEEYYDVAYNLYRGETVMLANMSFDGSHLTWCA